MNFSNFYYTEDKQFINEVRELLTEEEIDPSFVTKLINHLEKFTHLPYGDLDVAVYNELRKTVKGDNEQIKRLKKKVHDIIIKAKNKFLSNVQNKIEKITVTPKAEQTEMVISNQNIGDLQ